MLKKNRIFFQWQIIVLITALFTFVSFLLSTTPVASKEERVSTFDSKQINLPLLQTTPTLTPTSENNLQITLTPTPTLQSDIPLTPTLQGDLSQLSFTLNDIGYDDTILTSPYDNAGYRFQFPKNWFVQGDNNLLVLDLSYIYHETDPTFSPPNFFGDLTVIVNDEIVGTLTVEEEFEHRLLQIQLPQSLFADPDRSRNDIDVIFDANFLCDVPHTAQLTIHSLSSRFFLNYEVESIVPNLSVYPLPFYQESSFLLDNARFVLPSPQTNNDATNAIRIAAKLGDFTNARLPISSTLDIELADLLSRPNQTLDENLIVLGQPENNQLLSLLNETTELPIPFYERQLALASQGPTAVSPGDTFSYIFTATNTSTQDVTLSLIDALPQYTQLVECTPNCEVATEAGTVTWNTDTLAPDELATFSLTLSTTNLISDDVAIDNTITLIEDELGPVNTNSLSTTITANPAQPADLQQVSSVDESNYFFMYNGQAVAKEDGIIQEIISPWNENRVILIITGLNEAAVEKASIAISAETQLPGMIGPTALIKDVVLSDLNVDIDPPPINMTLQGLGYNDNTLRGGLVQDAEYRFLLPHGWQPSNDAYFVLRFSHTQLFDPNASSITVSFNNEPVTTFPLDKETASNGSIQINLPQNEFKPGANNSINVETNIKSLNTACGQNDDDGVWFTIRANSEIFLNQSEIKEVPLNLDIFPYPFDAQPTLFDLLFALPENPTQQQWEHTLNLAAILGDSAHGDTIVPIAILGDNISSDEDLSNYHIIALGQPTLNPLIEQANKDLPQPFIPNSNQIQQQNSEVIFRIPSNVDLGLVQLIPSPWNEKRAFVAITGTTEEGVSLSANATINNRSLRYTLVLVQADKAEAIDIFGLFESGVANAIATAVPDLVITSTITPSLEPDLIPTPVITSSSSLEEEIQSDEQPIWLIPLVIGTFLAVVVILAIAFWQSRRQKSNKQP